MKVFFTTLTFVLFLTLSACKENSKSLTASNAAIETEEDRFRPQLHFTPEKNWMNDPNGMFYYDGEYHLFYQYNPYGNKWGHMSWGHAVSKDMIVWEHLPVAMLEEEGVMIFSGSAVVDWNNSSGFGSDSKLPPIVAIYTSYDSNTGLQHQSIAFSTDKGRTFVKYEDNPVLDLKSKDFRDPKVFWYENEKKWVMTVALSAERKIQFYESKNLKDWNLMSVFGPYGAVKGVWECPDLFPLTTPEGETKWILEVDLGDGSVAGGSGGQYFIGEFDGRTFTSENISKNTMKEYVPEGEIIEDFENGFDFWAVQGTAFGNEPANGKVDDQQEVKDFEGRGLLNSFHGGDDSAGKMTSKPFTINKDYINFLIGGGAKSGEAEIKLIIDGRKVHSATGNNSEPLTWASWEVKDLKGKEVQLEILDNAKGGWGHICLDHIIQSNEKAYNVVENANWIDYGKDFYAAVSWSDIPKKDGRKLWLGWMNNWQYANEIPTGETWRSHMSIPREVQLLKDNDGFYLVQKPVRELDAYKKSKKAFDEESIDQINSELEELLNSLLYQLDFTISKESISEPMEYKIVCDTDEVLSLRIEKIQGDIIKVVCNRPNSGNIDFNSKFISSQEKIITTPEETLSFSIIADKSSVEIFTDNGRVVFTNLIFPKSNSIKAEFSSKNPNAVIKRLTAYRF